MWRSKTSHLKTMNLCNEFLVIYLSKKKQQFQKIGLQRKAMVYGTAIMSIKKYPLPIIAEPQLKTLYGIGDLLCEQLVPVIKYHYRQFLKEKPLVQNQMPSQAPQNQMDQEQTLKSKCRSLYGSRNNQEMQFPEKQQIEDDNDSKSSYSMQSASVNKPYKPRPKTQAANVLLAMRTISPQDYISPNCLKDYLKAEYKQLINQKQYSLLMDNLIKQGYVEKLFSDQSIKLTKKGINYSLILQGKTKAKDSQVKIKSMIMEFKSNITSNNLVEKIPEKITKNKIQSKGKNGLILMIDCRQIKDKNQQSFFESKLCQKYGIQCRTANLPIGDFLWVYENQVLDYIVERKKADDLASSIYDGRYKQQKLRLKNSRVSNIYFLFEGHLTGMNAKSEREVEGALMTTRIRDKFKVVKVVNITQSLKFLSFLTQCIANQLETKGHVQTLGTLEDFTLANGKSSNLTVQNIFGLSLKTIPGVGKNSVNEVLKYFNSFRGLYDQLSQFNCRSDRIQFLRQLLKGCGVRSNLPQLLVDLLYGSGQ